MQGFTRSQLVGAIVRDPNGASPASFENNLAVTTNATRLGTTLTAHATPHTKAATYTTLIAATAQIAYGIWIAVYDVGSTGADTGMLGDFATGTAAAEVDFLSNVDFGEASVSANAGAKFFYFPGLSIPAGSRISARIQATITVDTCVVAIWLDYRAQYQIANSAWVTYGANTAASQGTSVLQALNGFGSWIQIGSATSRNHNLFVPAFDSLGDTSVSASTSLLEIGYGPNAGSVTSIGVFHATMSAIENVGTCFPSLAAFVVASGSLLWARLAGTDAESRGVIIYGN